VSLQSERHPLASPAEQLRVLNPAQGSQRRFEEALRSSGLEPLSALNLTILQVNLGKLCNQTCKHCHVDAGPDRRESMSRETAELCIHVVRSARIPVLDITGGAPELNPNFRWLVEQGKALGCHVMDRCNLTVLLLPSQQDLAEFLAAHQVEVVASLPYFLAQPANAQRGDGVFEKSIKALRRLNLLGYGMPGSPLRLNLVYNPGGAFLPPSQQAIELEFRRELRKRHGIEFHSLFTITNMPVSRFLEFLLRSGNYDRYMQRLIDAYNPEAAKGVMCRTMLSVGWDGALYDCDFNQMLGLPLNHGAPRHIRDFDAALIGRRRIVVGQHCYGCTAGSGSSCGGSIAR
jgi:radical SAM/Cys-rich protein